MVMISIKTLLSVRDCCFCTAMVAMHDQPLIKPLFPSITCILGMTHISNMVQISNRNDTYAMIHSPSTSFFLFSVDHLGLQAFADLC